MDEFDLAKLLKQLGVGERTNRTTGEWRRAAAMQQDESLLDNGRTTSLMMAAAGNGGSECQYQGTDFLEVKFILIGIFATSLALISFLLNSFFVLVFALNRRLRKSPLYYFGVLAVLDSALALLYLALMAVPVYMDYFSLLWLYHLYLAYVRPLLTLSNFTMFASVLMILLATGERLLLTFSGKRVAEARRMLERRRGNFALLLMLVAGAYKLCTYFEVEVAEHANCTGFERYEVISAVPEDSNYRFWWMFVVRNIVDHIVPFFLLVLINFLIILALRRERFRATQHLAGVTPSLVVATADVSSRGRRQSEDVQQQRRRSSSTIRSGGSARSLRDSIRHKMRRQRLQKSASTAEEQAQKKNLRAATRALIIVVSMYLMSKVLQVATTFFETFASKEVIYSLHAPYSYVNDIISILTLVSSALRFPAYCLCNKPILTASRLTFRRLLRRTLKKKKGSSSNINKTICSSFSREKEGRINQRQRNGPQPLPSTRRGKSVENDHQDHASNKTTAPLLLVNGGSEHFASADGQRQQHCWSMPEANCRGECAPLSSSSPPGKRRVLKLIMLKGGEEGCFRRSWSNHHQQQHWENNNGIGIDKEDGISSGKKGGSSSPLLALARIASPDEDGDEEEGREELFC